MATHYHLNSTTLAPGSVIEPGNWGRIIRLIGIGHTRNFAEAVLEDIRMREYPDRPSRLDCSFCFDDLGEARFYKAAQNAVLMLIYEVELSEAAAVQHTTDWRAISHNGAMDLQWARSYWAGDLLPLHESGHACREVLTYSRLRIIRRLEG